MKIDNDTIHKVKALLHTKSVLSYANEFCQVYLTKRKTISDNTENTTEVAFCFEVIFQNTTGMNLCNYFDTREMEYARDSAVAFFLAIIQNNANGDEKPKVPFSMDMIQSV